MDYHRWRLSTINKIMNSINYPETTKYVVCHDGDKIFTYNIVEPQNCLESGLPFVEIFDTEEEVRNTFPQVFENLNQDKISEESDVNSFIEE